MLVPTTIDWPCGWTVTEPTATLVTLIAAEPLFPSLVAVIVVVPCATAVRRPCALIVATPVLELDQVTVRPLRVAPHASVSVAAICVDWPTVIDSGFGDTVTFATGACDTGMVAEPFF